MIAADLTPRERHTLRRAAIDMGLTKRWTEEWLNGQRSPAPWVRRALAQTISRPPHEVFNEHTAQQAPDLKQPGGRTYSAHDAAMTPRVDNLARAHFAGRSLAQAPLASGPSDHPGGWEGR